MPRSAPQTAHADKAPLSRFAELGVAMFEYVLTEADLAAMDAAFPQLPPRSAGARSGALAPGVAAWFAAHDGLRELANLLVQAPVCLSRLQVFDESMSVNWFVPWHQDRIADGHERPIAELERTLALHIYLDACTEDQGPLEVVPGSHLAGRLDATTIAQQALAGAPRLCLAERGDILAMRPLLIHRAQRARQPTARRVFHLEFCTPTTPHN